MSKTLKLYLKFNLSFFSLHLFFQNIIKFEQVSQITIFYLQYLLFCIFCVLFIKIDFSIFVISIPLILLYQVTIISFVDRSLTVEMLLYYLNNTTVSLEDIFSTFSENFESIIKKRIDEQEMSKIIEIEDSQITLTRTGKLFSNVYEFFFGLYE